MTTNETAAQTGSPAGPLPFDTAKAHQARMYEYMLGTDLVAPGLVRIEEWRPDLGTSDQGKTAGWVAVGRKHG